MSDAVVVEGVAFSYPSRKGRIRVLNDVSVRIRPGEWVAVMGPSGSGKSTLLQCAAGLVRPERGTVELDGIDVVHAPDRVLTELRRTRIGFVFQEFNLVPALTAAQNVSLPSRFAGRRVGRAAVHAALDSVGLGSLADRRPDEMSGGQRQRVAVARALIAEPAVLFADEPTGSLDLASGESVLTAIENLRSGGASVVMVTHDPRVAMRADRVLWLVDGQILGETADTEPGALASRLSDLEAGTS